MRTATSSSRTSASPDPKFDLFTEIRLLEVAIADHNTHRRHNLHQPFFKLLLFSIKKLILFRFLV